MIEKREAALARLETFERIASDPTRFFFKGKTTIIVHYLGMYVVSQLNFIDLGQQGSSVLRLEEARRRDQHHKVIKKN